MKTASHYSRLQVSLHWTIAAFVAAQYLFKGQIQALWHDRMTGVIPNEPFLTPHTIVGAVILLLTLWRLVLKFRLGAPLLPEQEHPAFQILARVTHIAFYALLIGLPLSGVAAWAFGLSLPAQVHGIGAKVMLALIVLHIIGAFAHKMWFKSDVMARMSPRHIFPAK